MSNPIDPKQEAQNIMADILEERDSSEIMCMSFEDALATVECYGHKDQLATDIANWLVWLSTLID
jgi:hypothetical protein